MGSMEERKDSGAAIVYVAAALMIILPVLYVASCGPVAWMLQKTEGGAEVYNAIYYPLSLLQGTWLGEAIFRYASWWYPPHPMTPA